MMFMIRYCIAFIFELFDYAENKSTLCICLGDVSDEDAVLDWLITQLTKDEIEDVTEKMLLYLIETTPSIAALFCKYLILFLLYVIITGLYSHPSMTIIAFIAT